MIGLIMNVKQQLYNLNIVLNPNKQTKIGNKKHNGCKLPKRRGNGYEEKTRVTVD